MDNWLDGIDSAVFLDGFIGVLLGGAVTAGAVIASLAHERDKERHGRVVDAAADVMGKSQRLAVMLKASAINEDEDDPPGSGRMFSDLLQMCFVLQAHAMTLRRSILPDVLKIVTLRLSEKGRGVVDRSSAQARWPDLERDLVLLSGVLGRWIAEPRRFNRRRPGKLWLVVQDPALVDKHLSAMVGTNIDATTADERGPGSSR